MSDNLSVCTNDGFKYQSVINEYFCVFDQTNVTIISVVLYCFYTLWFLGIIWILKMSQRKINCMTSPVSNSRINS